MLAFSPLFISLITAYGWRSAGRIVGGGCFVVSVLHGVFIDRRPKVDSQAPDSDTDENGSPTDSQAGTAAVDGEEKAAAPAFGQRTATALRQVDT